MPRPKINPRTAESASDEQLLLILCRVLNTPQSKLNTQIRGYLPELTKRYALTKGIDLEKLVRSDTRTERKSAAPAATKEALTEMFGIVRSMAAEMAQLKQQLSTTTPVSRGGSGVVVRRSAQPLGRTGSR